MLSLNKYLKINILLLAVYLFLFKSNFSQNLISNGSFELYNTPVNWNNWGGGFYDVSVNPADKILLSWEQFNSPDCFFSVCPHTFAGAPANRFGYSMPMHGNNYIGIGTYIKGGGPKEYLSQQLSYPLLGGNIYCASFFTSRADKFPYAIKNLGVYFSSSLPTMVSFQYINAIPQIENQNGFLTDTTQWIKIQGCFTAQGGEQYITIGNFKSDENTDTLFVGSNNQLSGADGYAYYYIDDITLIDQSTVGVSEYNVSNHINLFPNPSNGNMVLDYDLGTTNNAVMKLFDITGKYIKSYKLDTGKGMLEMNEQNLHNGIYFYHILVEGKTIKADKIVIIK